MTEGLNSPPVMASTCWSVSRRCWRTRRMRWPTSLPYVGNPSSSGAAFTSALRCPTGPPQPAGTDGEGAHQGDQAAEDGQVEGVAAGEGQRGSGVAELGTFDDRRGPGRGSDDDQTKDLGRVAVVDHGDVDVVGDAVGVVEVAVVVAVGHGRAVLADQRKVLVAVGTIDLAVAVAVGHGRAVGADLGHI